MFNIADIFALILPCSAYLYLKHLQSLFMIYMNFVRT